MPNARSIINATPTFEKRFWAKVNKNGPIPEHTPELGRCWVWTASLFGNGYGQIGLGHSKQGNMPAHRASWEIHNGPIEGGLFVLHRCDNQLCVNPDHLFLGTQVENLEDMTRKGRRRWGDFRGEGHGQAKMTEALVYEIRSRFAGGERICDLAREYGLQHGGLSAIVHRRSWRHLE